MDRRQRRASPTEYLWLLQHSPLWYHRLLDEHAGDLALAAWELAVLRIAASSTGRCVPCEREVWAAAQEVGCRTGRLDPVPPREVLAADCRASGRDVT